MVSWAMCPTSQRMMPCASITNFDLSRCPVTITEAPEPPFKMDHSTCISGSTANFPDGNLASIWTEAWEEKICGSCRLSFLYSSGFSLSILPKEQCFQKENHLGDASLCYTSLVAFVESFLLTALWNAVVIMLFRGGGTQGSEKLSICLRPPSS